MKMKFFLKKVLPKVDKLSYTNQEKREDPNKLNWMEKAEYRYYRNIKHHQKLLHE